MPRPYIFIATADPAFEKIARQAIEDSWHSIRASVDLRTDCRFLCAEMEEIALAIIDLDFKKRALALLHILESAEATFPVLAVAGHTSLFDTDETISHATAMNLKKPATIAALHRKIVSLCLDPAKGAITVRTARLFAASSWSLLPA